MLDAPCGLKVSALEPPRAGSPDRWWEVSECSQDGRLAHQYLPSDGPEVDVMAITESDRNCWPSRREICSERRPFPAARMSSALGNCAQTLQSGRPYFVPTMQRATPGILTLPSSS